LIRKFLDYEEEPYPLNSGFDRTSFRQRKYETGEQSYGLKTEEPIDGLKTEEQSDGLEIGEQNDGWR
jgi:hypothetical protein